MIEALLLLLSVTAAAYLLAPAFRRGPIGRTDPRTALENARVAAVQSLRDLELDWQTGKLSDEDYRAQRATLEAELAAVGRRLAALAEEP
ncbi:MAG: hypothetical protein QN174_09685 [Armatimonadota bacterium]|nr:hypothetical protein [Armatimonadota bacterium]MDR7422793.1 hypothetical protein [Armatimonadota bacterium]MDR7453347.1 hypothetical protein [Armatimonadota bacterium]MDR7457033.1 hypothetical protein [Armatimonadota bacterium]MDR7497215.1 hypothetical protein [Armatimonadota bacterium]